MKKRIQVFLVLFFVNKTNTPAPKAVPIKARVIYAHRHIWKDNL